MSSSSSPSFSFITPSARINDLLLLTSTSSSTILSVKLRSPSKTDEQKLNLSNNDNPAPPLIVEIISRRRSSDGNTDQLVIVSEIFPACSALRTTDNKTNSTSSSSSKKTRSHHQILVPDFDLYENEQVSSQMRSLDEVPHRVLADDEGKCILIAETVEALFEFVMNLQEQNDDDESSSCKFVVSGEGQQNAGNKNENLLFTEEERINILENIVAVDNNNMSQDSSSSLLLQEDTTVGSTSFVNVNDNDNNDNNNSSRRQELVQRINSSIIEAAGDALSTLSTKRLAQIYDEVDSRKEKMQKTKSAGKDTKTIVVPCRYDGTNDESGAAKMTGDTEEEENNALMKIAF